MEAAPPLARICNPCLHRNLFCIDYEAYIWPYSKNIKILLKCYNGGCDVAGTDWKSESAGEEMPNQTILQIIIPALQQLGKTYMRVLPSCCIQNQK